WNLEPTQGLNDDFQRWAWSELEAQDAANPSAPLDWRPAWRFEMLDGIRTLRYMRADPAASAACITCHNQLEARPETIGARAAAGIAPGRQWSLHQLLGAIEVQIPVDRVEALAAEL